jgi:uncharacterized integral membrane protein
MGSRRNFLMINPIASGIYGFWFFLWPSGYPMLVERMTDAITSDMKATLVALGAALIALAWIQFVIIYNVSRRTIRSYLAGFGVTWLIFALGGVYSSIFYSSAARDATLPMLQSLVFVILGVGFLFLSNRSNKETATW